MSVLVGKKAPDFAAKAVIDGGDMVEQFSMSQYEGEKNVVFFFYPADFTFVCPTELHAFQEKLGEFEKRETVVIGCSVDSEFSHWAWLNTPRNKGGIEGVTYALVADQDMTIASNYGVLAGEYEYEEDADGNPRLVFEGTPRAYRGLFLIDKQGTVRHQVVNDMPLGRNIDEAIRMVDALRHYEDRGEVCPANWSEGKDAMHATSDGVADYLSSH